MSLTSKRIFQFGDFELRVGSRLLMREGKPVPLGSKAFEVLTCLVVHAGEVVSKEELLKTVWPESFVEEGNLSQHVFALRKALGDRSKYIVTVPGRGYQFTEPVRDVTARPDSAPGVMVQTVRERAHLVLDETAAPEDLTHVSAPTELRHQSSQWPEQTSDGSLVFTSVRSAMKVAVTEEVVVPPRTVDPSAAHALPGAVAGARYARWAALVCTAAVLSTGAYLWWRAHARPPASRKVVLTDLDNRTGDPAFDQVLRKALEIDLDQSPFLEVMSETEALNTLHLMDRAPDTALTPQLAKELCERSNRDVLIAGSIARLGNEYLLTLEATACNSGKRLGEARAQAATREDTLAALDSAADRLRRTLGESTESVERFQVPVAQATTSSLEALKQYSIGEYLLGRRSEEENEVLPFFQRAVELDPQFAMAYAAIATSYNRVGESDIAAPYYQKAFDLSNQVSEKERLYIRAHYYADNLKDLEQGIKAYQMWAQVYPNDWGPWLNIANLYMQLGQFPPAIAAAEQSLRLDPTRGIVYSSLARVYMHVGRYADAKSTAQRALALGKDSYQLHATLFEIAFLERDQSAMQREIDWSAGKASQWDFLTLRACAAANEGRYRSAEQLFRTAYEAAEREHLPETADQVLVHQASAEFYLGHPSEARATLALVRHDINDPDRAVLEAKLGMSGRAASSTVSASLAGTLWDRAYRPRIQAAVALSRARPQDAIAALNPAAEYEFADGFAIPAERSDAYLASKQFDLAAAELQQIVSHPGIDPVSPLYSLAYLRLGQAESAAGHAAQSRAAYDRLFLQWKNADPDLPLLLAARKDYAALPR